MPWVCRCLILVLTAEAGRTALKRCPKETGRLNSYCLPHHSQEGSSSVPHGSQSSSHPDSPPLRGESEKNIEGPERPATLPVWKFRGTQARASRPLHARQLGLAADGTAGGGAPAPPQPGIREVTSFRSLLAGAPSPTDTPFLRRQPPATLC